MERAPMADHFTILGRVLLMREPPCRGSNGTEEPRCRVVVGFDVAFHKVSTHVQPDPSAQRIVS